MNPIEAQRDFVAFAQTNLYAHLKERRERIRHDQIQALINHAFQSPDPVVRAIAAGIVSDGAVWQAFDMLEQEIRSADGSPQIPERDKLIEDYDMPEIVLDTGGTMPDYRP